MDVTGEIIETQRACGWWHEVRNTVDLGVILTLYRPAMPFGNRTIYFRGFF